MAEKLTTLAKRLRPFINGQVGAIAATGAFMTECPDIDLVGNRIGRGGDTILIFNSDGTPVEEFAATEAGVAQALAAATTNNVIIFPNNILIALTSAIIIPANVTVKYANLTFSGFSGNAVTLSTNSVLDNANVYFDGTGQANANAIVANGVTCTIRFSVGITENATSGVGIYAKGTTRHVGANIFSSTGRANDGTNNYGLYLNEYSYATYCLGQASSVNTNAGIFMNGTVAGEYNAPLAFACYAFGSQSDNSYGLRVNDNCYGTAVNCHLYGLKADGSDAYGVEIATGATFYSFGNTWTNLINSGSIEYLSGDRAATGGFTSEIIVINPHPGNLIDECVARAYVGGKVYWSSHRAQGTSTALGYEYAYNTLTETNSELASQAGQAGWRSVYNETDGLIYAVGQIYADSLAYRAAIWTINPSSGAVTYYPLNAAGEATGDINELVAVLDDDTQIVAGERGAGGLTTGSDYPNGGGLWTIPKATLGTPATYTRVYEDTATPKREWKNLAKYGSTYLALLLRYSTGAYAIQSSTNLTTWNVDVDGTALSLNDIHPTMIHSTTLNKIFAATVNSSRQFVLRWYDGSWSSKTFANLTVSATNIIIFNLGTLGQDLVMVIADYTALTHDIYILYNLNDDPDLSLIETDVAGVLVHDGQLIESGPYVYYGTSWPGGLNRIGLWSGVETSVLFNDAEGDPADVDRTARADGTSDYSARRDHRHELGTVNLDDLSDVNTTGVGTGDIIYKSAGDWIDYPLGIGSKISITSNKLRIGNSSGGNYLEIDLSTGNLRLVGDATAWDDLRVSASIAKPGATAPSYKAFGPSGNLQALMFEASHHDEVFFEIQMPHNWKEGSDLHPHVHWTPTTTDAGNVVWELEYSWTNIDGTFGAPSNMATDARAAGGTAWVHKMDDFKTGGSEIISGTGKTLSSMLVCRLHRNSNSGSDTLNKDVALLEFDIHYEVDSFGSDLELIKDASSALLLETGDYLLLENGDNLLLE